MALTIEEFIEKWTEGGEESKVGENLTLNRGPANQDSLAEMQKDVPEGTSHTSDWAFGDEVQRLWFNPDVPFVAGFSKLSHSIHIWRYPDRLTYIKHAKEIGEFFSKEAFSGFDKLTKLVEDPNTPDVVMDRPISEIIDIKKNSLAEKVLGDILHVTARELQVDVMIQRLAE